MMIISGICTFSIFLFLIPFVVDPAVATINHDFVETPVQCRVVLNKYILGGSSYCHISIHCFVLFL